jgi:uncharacterized phiE125 gp8 family phage protein
MSVRLVQWPEGEQPAPPVSLQEAKDHARVKHTHEDAAIEALLESAIGYAELGTRRSIRLRRWDLVLDGFPASRVIELPRPPLLEVEEIEYRAASGDLVALAFEDVAIDLQADPAAIRPLPGASWPATKDSFDAVRIRFVAGYRPVEGEEWPEAPIIPAVIKSAILSMVEANFVERGRFVVPAGVDRALWSERVHW